MYRIAIILVLIFNLLVSVSLSQQLTDGQRALQNFIENVNINSKFNPQDIQLNYHDVNSDIARLHTEELRAAQFGISNLVGDEEIVFCLANGINVQHADGTGRRLIISRGAGHKFFLYPAWSLDGKRIAFAANRTDSRVVDLTVANADGSNAQVILTLNAGYYESYIQSISWSWDSEYIMFSYGYDDINNDDVFVVCTIHWSGSNFFVGPGADRAYCQLEPVIGSNRYAYIAKGSPFSQNTDLRVSDLDGTNDVLWKTHQGVIAGFRNIAWNSPNSIYTIIRDWAEYPNREVLIRFNRLGQNTTYTLISYSDPGAELWSPTVSPDRNQIYDAEQTSTTSTMYLIKLTPAVTVEPKGIGFFPNWRQKIPVTKVNEDLGFTNSFHLSNNYPNPFNPSTKISYSIPKQSNVSLKVFSFLGSEVAELVNGEVEAGYHSVDFSGSDLPSGVYFYRIQAGSFIDTKKMVLLK